MIKGRRMLAMMVLLIAMLSHASALAETRFREIVINIPAFTLYLYESGIPIRQYPIGIGNVVKPSLLGETTIINQVINPTYYPPRWWERDLQPIPPGPDNPVGTRWLGLGFASYGIHGTNNPDSIGKALSSGCIRMYNEDVEELTTLTSIGTPVSLVYETMLVSIDPLLQTRAITVYADIYNLGTNTYEQANSLVMKYGWSDIHQQALKRTVNAATGRITPLASNVQLAVNGELAESLAAKYGKRYYVPLHVLIDKGMSPTAFQNIMWWDSVYVDVVELANGYGLGYQMDDRLDLFSVSLFIQDEHIDIVPHLVHNQLYLPVKALSETIGLPIVDRVKDEVKLINGKEYLSQEHAEFWGFSLQWEFPNPVANLQIPWAYVDDLFLGIALAHQATDEYYVPINELYKMLDTEVIWLEEESILLFYDTYGIQALVAGELIYVPGWVIEWLMPGAELAVVYP